VAEVSRCRRRPRRPGSGRRSPSTTACGVASAARRGVRGLKPGPGPGGGGAGAGGGPARIRTDLAREMFAEQHHRDPATGQELIGFLRRVSRPARSAVAGFDLTFSPVKSVSTLWAVAPGPCRRGWRRRTTPRWRRPSGGWRSRSGTPGSAPAARPGRHPGFGDGAVHPGTPARGPDCTPTSRCPNKGGRPWTGGGWRWNARMLYRSTSPAPSTTNRPGSRTHRRARGLVHRTAGESGKRPVREITGVDDRLNQEMVQPRVGDHQDEHRVAVPVPGRPRPGADHRGDDLAAAAGEPVDPATETRTPLPERATRAVAGRGPGGPRRPPRPGHHDHHRLGRPADARQVVDVRFGGGSSRPRRVATVRRASGAVAGIQRLREALRVLRGRLTDTAQVRQVAEAVTRRAVAGDHSVPIGMDTEVPGNRPRRAHPRRWGIGCTGRESAAVNLTVGARGGGQDVTAAGRVDGRRVRAADVALAELSGRRTPAAGWLNTGRASWCGTSRPAAAGPVGVGARRDRENHSHGGPRRGVAQRRRARSSALAPQASAAQELGAAIPGVRLTPWTNSEHDTHHRTPGAGGSRG